MSSNHLSTAAGTIAVTLLLLLTGLAVALPSLQSLAQSSQPVSLTIVWDNGGPCLPERALSSQLDQSYPFSSQAADDFRLSMDTEISMVQWWGVVWQTYGTGPSNFRVLFYADDGTGAPTGAGLQDPSSTALAVYDLPSVSGTMVGECTYLYNVSLPSPFLAEANTTYWLAIQSIGSLAENGQWGWAMTTNETLAAAVQGFPLTGTAYWSAMGAGDHAFLLGRDDLVAPVTTCSLNGTFDGSVYTSDVIVTLNATDNSSGVNYTMYRVDEGIYTSYLTPFIVSGTGDHIVWFYSVDMAGNQELEQNVSFSIILPVDTEPPVTTASLNGTIVEGSYSSNVTVTLAAVDNDSGVNYTMLKVDAGEYSLYTDPVLVSGTGTHTVWFYSMDLAGNQELEKNISFTIIPLGDTEPPITSCFLSGTMNGTIYTSNVSVILTAFDNDSGVNYTMVKVDNGSYEQYVNPFLVSGDGDHTVWFYSVDVAGNQETEKNASFTILLPGDITAPVTVCQLDGGMNGTTYISNVTVTLTASDNGSGVNYTMYKVDEDAYTQYLDSFLVTSEGSHTIWFYSVDNAGNQELEKNASFTIIFPAPDTQPPQTAYELNGTMNGTIYTSNVTVTLAPIDEGSGVNYTMVKIDNAAYLPYTKPFFVSGNGTHTIQFYSVDNAGNQETEQSVSFTIALSTIRLSLDVVFGLGVHAFIRNEGTRDAIAVPWNITVPGSLIFFGNQVNGTVDVPAGGEVLVKDFVIGLGRPTITVNAGGLTKSAKAVVLFFLLVTVAD